MDRDSLNFSSTKESGEALLFEGRQALARGDTAAGLKCFDAAMQLDPHYAPLYFTQGAALLEYGKKYKQTKILTQAHKRLEMAAYLDPHHAPTWLLWSEVLYRLGRFPGQTHHLQNAKEKIAHALTLAQTAESYWTLARICKAVAAVSGEALELHEALGAFHQALLQDKEMPALFWKEYATTCSLFSVRIGDMQMQFKAMSLMKQALTLAPEVHSYWQELAAILHTLYQHTHDEQHFMQANECYKTAAELKVDDKNTWINWAKLLLNVAHLTFEVKQLRACIEKCERASLLDPENLATECIWAEALALLGSESDQLELLLAAQNKVEKLIDTSEPLPEVYFTYGSVLTAFGNYFNDPEYYYEATEKFQEGLSLNRTCHTHWHAIGRLYTLLSESEQNSVYGQRALYFLKRALAIHPCSSYTIDYAVSLFKLGEMTREQDYLEEAIVQFQKGFSMQKNALYAHPEGLFHYACCLDFLGDFHEEDSYYLRALEIFSHVLMIDPDFHTVHHRLALTLSHLGELTDDVEHFYRAIEHLRLCAKQDEENDVVHLDWAVILINIACRLSHSAEAEGVYLEAEEKLWHVLRLGNPHAYYHLACLYSLLTHVEKAMLCLRKASSMHILPTLDELMQDEWLDAVRCSGEFIDFYGELERRSHFQKEE